MAAYILIASVPYQDPEQMAAFSEALEEIFRSVAPHEYDIAAGTFSTKDTNDNYTFTAIICQTKILHQLILLELPPHNDDDMPIPEPALDAAAFAQAFQEKWHKHTSVVATDVVSAQELADELYKAPESTGFNVFAQ